MDYFIIAAGGTGVRVAKAILFLTASGISNENIHLLVIDKHTDNGNLIDFKDTLQIYKQFHQDIIKSKMKEEYNKKEGYPSPHGNKIFRKKIDDYSLGFGDSDNMTFSKFLKINNKDPKEFTNLEYIYNTMYTDADLAHLLNSGFEGHTNIGTMFIYKSLLEQLKVVNSEFKTFLTKISNFKNKKIKILIIGSLFGGTGASVLSVMPILLKDQLKDVEKDNLEISALMLSTYFTLPSPSNKDQITSFNPKDEDFKAMEIVQLDNYRKNNPGYKYFFLLGGEEKITNKFYNPGNKSQLIKLYGEKGEEENNNNQKNEAHYIEFFAALQAFDYFNSDPLNYPDGTVFTIPDQENISISWDNFAFLNEANETKFKKLFNNFLFSTSFLYHLLKFKILNENLYERDEQFYSKVFLGIPKKDEYKEFIKLLSIFINNFLNWCREISNKQLKENGEIYEEFKLFNAEELIKLFALFDDNKENEELRKSKTYIQNCVNIQSFSEEDRKRLLDFDFNREFSKFNFDGEKAIGTLNLYKRFLFETVYEIFDKQLN